MYLRNGSDRVNCQAAKKHIVTEDGKPKKTVYKLWPTDLLWPTKAAILGCECSTAL